MPSRLRPRRARGGPFPSPVVMLSVVAVAMAAIAYVATQGQAPTEREVTPAPEPPSTRDPRAVDADDQAEAQAKPAVDRGKVYVEVYNNSGITGLAGAPPRPATQAGWQVVGSDNWYGTIPASTVYYPPELKARGPALALDLGIRRGPAVDPMKLDRLTVILTADHA